MRPLYTPPPQLPSFGDGIKEWLEDIAAAIATFGLVFGVFVVIVIVRILI